MLFILTMSLLIHNIRNLVGCSFSSLLTTDHRHLDDNQPSCLLIHVLPILIHCKKLICILLMHLSVQRGFLKICIIFRNYLNSRSVVTSKLLKASLVLAKKIAQQFSTLFSLASKSGPAVKFSFELLSIHYHLEDCFAVLHGECFEKDCLITCYAQIL